MWGDQFVGLVSGPSPDYQVLRMAETILVSCRSFRLPPQPDLSSITDEGALVPEPSRMAIEAFFAKVGIPTNVGQNRKRVLWTKWHYSARGGPNGPALASSLDDLSVLSPARVADLGVLGGGTFLRTMAQLFAVAPFYRAAINRFRSGKFSFLGPPPKGKDQLLKRKLVCISDKEGKTRVVAILDYFSQSVLRPLHFFLFELLTKLPADLTFAHGRFRDVVGSWDKSTVFYSVDMTNATDVFPIR